MLFEQAHSKNMALSIRPGYATCKYVLVAVTTVATLVVLMTSSQQSDTNLRGIRYKEDFLLQGTKDETAVVIFEDQLKGEVHKRPHRVRVQNTTQHQNITKDTCNLDRRFKPDGSMPLIILFSFPGSGNTWVRYLLERSSGIYSGSVYNDRGTGNTGKSVFRRSDPCSGKTIVVKSHSLINKKIRKCKIDGAIILLRNPYGAYLAEFNRQKSGKTGTAPPPAFRKKGWKRFVLKASNNWLTKMRDQPRLVSNRLLVYYEDLVENTERELRRMLDFLNVTQKERRIQCVLRESAGNYKRKHKNIGFNPYTIVLNRTIDKHIRTLRESLKAEFGYTLPSYESKHLRARSRVVKKRRN